MMAARTEVEPVRRGRAAVKGLLWLALAVAVSLSVLAINGRPLFYWDTIGYIQQGQNALAKVGFAKPAPPAAAVTAMPADVGGTVPAVASPDAAGPKTVDGSRSLFYSVLSGFLANLGVLDLLVVLHTVAVLVAAWIPLRVASRRFGGAYPVPKALALTILASGVGSLPFFVAYLMPDIFAPVMILSLATLTVFGRDLRWWELLLTLGLGAVAVAAHLSHLGIAVLMMPLAIVTGLVLSRRNWWLVTLLTGLIVLAGFAQQVVIRSAAKSVANSVVVIKPFLTARLIQDGPGLTYLQSYCPRADEPTCALFSALSKSDDPLRLTASNIIFQTSANLGSFRLMSEADQVRVAQAQVGFFLDVLADQPFGTVLAFLKNTMIQSVMVSIDMTIPTQNIVDQHKGVDGLIGGPFDHGRITRDTGWIAPLTIAQGFWYIAAAMVLGWLLTRSDAPREMKAFAVLLILGVLVNAFVCGGISQPASRYGARMVWLVPFAASMLFLFRNAGARRPGAEAG